MTTHFSSAVESTDDPGPTDSTYTEDPAALDVAEADLAAADAEAKAARAVADAARARARVLRLRADPPPDPPSDDGAEPGSTPDDSTPDASAPDASTPDDSTEDTRARRRRGSGTARAVGRTLVRGCRGLRHPTGRGIAVTTMSLVTLGAIVATGLMVSNHTGADADDARANAFLVAADQGVEAITTLDYKNAAKDVERVLDQSTGTFYDDFNGRSEDFASVIEQSQVTTTGNVTASALESMTDDSAVVLVSAKSEVTNAAGAQQEPRIWRLRVTVTAVDGGMKISKVDFVP